MREAIGSSWLIYLVITFILVYVFFIAFIMNYASAYRAANYVVTQIENCQGRMEGCSNDYEGVVKKKYHYNGRIDVCSVSNGSDSYVFRVTLYVDFEAPLFGRVGVMKVKSETKTIPNIPNVMTMSGYGSCK